MSVKLRPIAVWRTRASPGPGDADLDLLVTQFFGAAGLVHANSVNAAHLIISLRWLVGRRGR